MTRIWRSNRVPAPPHPFAHFIGSDEWVLISGIGGHDELGNLPDSAEEQTIAAFEKIKRILEAEGSGLHEIVWIKPYVTERAHAMAMDAVIRKYLPGPAPASGALTIVGLVDPRMSIELDVWAHKGARIVAEDRGVLFADPTNGGSGG